MKVYRGLKDILFKNINPYHINDSEHTYGQGTSYAYEKSLAEEYCNSIVVKNYGWILTYNYEPKNPYYVSTKDFVDLDSFGEYTDMFYNQKIIKSSEFGSLLKQDNFDCAIFDYDENDSHVMILTEGSLDLVEIELFTENQSLVDFLKELDIPNDGTNFIIPNHLLTIIDDFLITL